MLIKKKKKKNRIAGSNESENGDCYSLMLVVVCLKSDDEGHYQMIAWNE